MRTLTRPFLALTLPAMLVLAACSSSGSSAAPSAAVPTVAPSVAAPSVAAPSVAAPSAAAAGEGSIVLVDSALGRIIVDGDESGKTVYAFTPDSAGTPTCYDDCAANWPPVVVEGTPTAGTGLDAALLTVVDRTDGTKQLKYGDWPLYYFAGDTAAGDTNGQGVGTKWYVIGADGKLIGQ